MVGTRPDRISIRVSTEDKQKYAEAAKKMNIAASTFSAFLMAVGYQRLLEEPEILTRMITR